MTALNRFIKTFKKYYYVKDDEYIHIVFGVIFANRLDEKPVWLYLVGPPSSGKTEMVETCVKSSETYFVSWMKPAALISGKGKKESLLPKLDGKVLVITDFTAMLNMRYNDLMEVLGRLRVGYDGKVSAAFGTGGVSCESKFGLIACVTNAIDRHLGLVADLGERFLTYRLPHVSKFEESKMSMMAMSTEGISEKEENLSEAALQVLERSPSPATISEYDKLRIMKIAQVVAQARCMIVRDRVTREPELPSPELAMRISTQLANLAIGIAMVREKKKVTKEEIKLVQKVGLHSITAKRLMLINTLLYYWPDYVSLERIIEKITFKFSDVTVRRWLDEMLLLSLIDRRETLGANGKMYYRWQLKDGRLLKDVLFSKIK